MEKKQICKICNKRFANGKAMGGHMRSHLAKLPVPPKPNPSLIQPQKQLLLPPNNNPFSQKPPLSPPSSSSSLNYTSSGNPSNYCYTAINPTCDIVNTSVTFLDGESEAESPRNSTRKRSKRRPKLVEKVNDHSPERLSSSVSDCFNEEDAATCLLMLSSSIENERRKGKQVIIEQEVDDVDKFFDKVDEEVKVKHQEDDDDEQEEEEEDESYCLTRPKSFKGKYRCETCNKTFRSYQALGGHRASHKRIKIINSIVKEGYYEDQGSASFDNVVGGGVVDHYRMFKCCFCDKVFESGQALGGHKKVHFPYLGNNPIIPNPRSSILSRAKNLIDLNLPPPEAHEDEKV